jgi:DNA polymerase III subunit gamma/tau
MIVKRKRGDLNKTYRPCKISEIVGHDTIKKTIGNALAKGILPHSMMFTGPSGCGKTTAARIIALGLNCVEGPTPEPCCKCDSCKATLALSSFATVEVDAGRTGDVGTTRRILDDLPAAPMGGERFKIAIFDEAHKLGGASGSEDALLKFLEDTPEHVYIILCTNEPQKLKEVTRNRCKTIQFGRLLDKDIYQLLEQVSQFEGYTYTPEILKYIVEESNGVPRQSLSYLQQIAGENSWTKDAASMIINAGLDIDSAEVINLGKILIESINFRKAVDSYKKMKNIPIETIRMGICGYFVGCLRRAKNFSEAQRFSAIIDLLQEPYFGNPKPEHKLINTLFKITQILHRRT